MKSRQTALGSLFFAWCMSALASTCAPEDAPDSKVENILVTAKSFEVFVDDDDKQRMIVSLGTLKNTAGACFRNVLIEANYFDSKGTLVDSVTRRLNPSVIPPRDEITFRVIGNATRPKEDYVSQKLRVVTADTGAPAVSDSSREDKLTKPKDGSRIITDFIAAFGPMLLLLAVFYYAYYGKRSAVTRQVDLIKKQNEILGSMSLSIARLAEAADRRDPSGPSSSS